MHSDEPSVEDLKKMYRELMAGKSTDDNMKKVAVLDKQIKRREAEGTFAAKVEEKIVEKIS